MAWSKVGLMAQENAASVLWLAGRAGRLWVGASGREGVAGGDWRGEEMMGGMERRFFMLGYREDGGENG